MDKWKWLDKGLNNIYILDFENDYDVNINVENSYNKGVFSCDIGFNFDGQRCSIGLEILEKMTLEEAKKESIKFSKKVLTELLESLNKYE